MSNSLEKIPTEELSKDLEEGLADERLCILAMRLGIAYTNEGNVMIRLRESKRVNLRIIQELDRRSSMSEALSVRVARLTAEGFYPGRVEFVQKNDKFIVAVVGQICDWAAYQGKTGWNVTMTKNNGDKIDKKIAQGLFPEFKKLYYRE